MSTENPLPIQLAVLTTSGKAPQASSDSLLTSDSKGVFNGLLSGELTAASDTVDPIALKESLAKVILETEGLPANGNSLPVDANIQFEADIAVLTESETNLPLVADFQIQLPITITKEGFGIALQPSARVVDTLRTLDSARVLAEKGQDIAAAQLANVKPGLSLSALSNLGLEGETSLSTQVTKNSLLQGSLSAQIKHTESGLEAGQISRVIEQFSDLTQRIVPVVTSPTLTTSVGGITTGVSESSLASATQTQLSVDVPVQDKRWQKAFAQRVVWSVGNNQSAQLRIHPAELGRIDIQVNVENDKASVVFNTQSGMVKEAIELALPRLREMLSEQGIDLVEVNVNHDDINQQHDDAGNKSDDKNGLSDAMRGLSSEDDSQQEFVSHIIIDDDVIDYYV